MHRCVLEASVERSGGPLSNRARERSAHQGSSGRKTDTKDGQWIAELLQHGLRRGRYIPPVVIRDLRDLTRARTSRSLEHSRIASRVQTVLEDANSKLARVASNTLGKSGRAILDAIIDGGREFRTTG